MRIEDHSRNIVKKHRGHHIVDGHDEDLKCEGGGVRLEEVRWNNLPRLKLSALLLLRQPRVGATLKFGSASSQAFVSSLQIHTTA